MSTARPELARQEPAVEAVVPAYNEETTVAETVQALARCPAVGTVWVVDDGSTDSTVARAAAAGARVLRLGRRRGKAQALLAGAARTRAPWLLFADADLGPSAARLAVLVERALAGQADMLIAAPPRRPGRHGLGAAVGLARWGLARLGGRVLEAPLSGQRILRRTLLELVQPLPRGWGIEVALTLAALRAGLSVVEVPVPIAHRVTRMDLAGFLHRGHQLVHIAWTLAACAWQHPAARRRGGVAAP
ncbi:glycosyltransferase family 2 protein [Thermaerobacter subterraneus]|uniref:Glucosyl-3-phosphoglycerate synthase n=1 Tax=Thermaerobacter subterraneus DSM 13965 TaxID=867903 RepID=K6PLU8_9FIRM|nr:glycosyltransferase [Thermaerobacter subterraneus]EKP93847.1 glycosyl transferase [Thermaerobacter subterraneus DSM 13965]